MNNQYLEIGETEERGRGFFARTEISEGTVILSISKAKFITYELLIQNPLFYTLVGVSKSRIAEFAFYLAYSSKKIRKLRSLSTVQKYLANLPPNFHNLICWSDSQLGKLATKDLVNEIRRKKANLRQAYDFISDFLIRHQEELLERSKDKAMKEFSSSRRGSRRIVHPRSTHDQQTIRQEINTLKSIAFSDLLQFVSAIQSRNIYFATENDRESEVGVLIPALEMFNHSIFSKCHVEYIEEKYQVITKANILKGEEVFLNYGNYSIEKYLQFYGMIPTEGHEKEENSKKTIQAQAGSLVPTLEGVREQLIKRYNQSVSLTQGEKQ